jgi:hypothetical protein
MVIFCASSYLISIVPQKRIIITETLGIHMAACYPCFDVRTLM